MPNGYLAVKANTQKQLILFSENLKKLGFVRPWILRQQLQFYNGIPLNANNS